MATFLNQVQRNWFARHISGMTVTSQTPLNTLKRVYYVQFLGGAPTNRGLDELEQDFLRQSITNAGGVPLNTDLNSPLWRQLVTQLGLHASPYINDNMVTFFSNAA